MNDNRDIDCENNRLDEPSENRDSESSTDAGLLTSTEDDEDQHPNASDTSSVISNNTCMTNDNITYLFKKHDIFNRKAFIKHQNQLLYPLYNICFSLFIDSFAPF